MLADKVEHVEVALGVPDDGAVVFQLQQADVPMMVLQGLELQLGTILPVELEPFIAATVRGDVLE